MFYANAISRLKEIEYDIAAVMASLDMLPQTDGLAARQDRLLVLQREAGWAADALGRLYYDRKAGKFTDVPVEKIVLQVNRAAILESIAYAAAAVLSQLLYGSAVHAGQNYGLIAVERLNAGQDWRDRIRNASRIGRFTTRVERWVLDRQPLGGADLDFRTGCVQTGVGVLVKLDSVPWQSVDPLSVWDDHADTNQLQLLNGVDLARRLVRNKSAARGASGQRELILHSTYREIGLGTSNSSASVYHARAVLAAVRCAAFFTASSAFRKAGMTRAEEACRLEAANEAIDAGRMLTEYGVHQRYDRLRRLGRQTPRPDFVVPIGPDETAEVVSGLHRLFGKTNPIAKN